MLPSLTRCLHRLWLKTSKSLAISVVGVSTSQWVSRPTSHAITQFFLSSNPLQSGYNQALFTQVVVSLSHGLLKVWRGPARSPVVNYCRQAAATGDHILDHIFRRRRPVRAELATRLCGSRGYAAKYPGSHEGRASQPSGEQLWSIRTNGPLLCPRRWGPSQCLIVAHNKRS